MVIHKAIDFDALRDLLGDVAEDGRERYQFTWPGKREAKAEARRPIYKTMIPEPGKSKDWDTTENLYIEGDNLDALKILKETYAGKVKLIYIDPPYNTGHDFVYDDDFAKTRGEYDIESGEYDEEGGRLVANPESSGRFHSDWCSMIYPRLLLARDLLAADGAIFISIDDRESENLKKICDEVFGRSNFISQIVWQKKYSPQNDALYFSTMHEYLLCYARKAMTKKGDEGWRRKLLPRTDSQNAKYKNPDNDPRGPWKTTDLTSKTKAVGHSYEITSPSGKVFLPSKGRQWAPAKETFDLWLADNRIWFGADGSNMPAKKTFLSEVQDGSVPNSIWFREDVGDSQEAIQSLDDLMSERVFDTPKPVGLLHRIVQLFEEDNFTVLDFFSGSGTLAESVMRQNAEDGGSRKVILVQIPEEISGSYPTLCSFSEERIRRAGAKVAAEIDKENEQLELGAEPKPYPDLGFRVLRIDSSNFKDFYLTPGQTEQANLFDYVDNVKEGRTDLDLLFEILPKLGIPYSAKIEERTLAGKKVFFVDDDKLAACFDVNVGADTIEEMAKAKPWYAVIRDASMADDATHANYEELFRTYSPDTIPQVI